MLTREVNVPTTGQFDDVLNKERRERIRKGYTGIEEKRTSLDQSRSEDSQKEGTQDEGPYRGSRYGVNSSSSSRGKREESRRVRDNYSSSKRSRDEQYDSGSYQSSQYSERDRNVDYGRHSYR